MTDTLAPPIDIAAGQPVAGFRPPPRYRTIRAVDGSMWDGSATESAPLTVTLRTSISGAELEYLKWARQRSIEANDDRVAFEAVAPFVQGWNVQRRTFDPETGALGWEPAPPPAEAGADALAEVEPTVALFVIANLIAAPTTLGEARGRPSTRSGEPPAGESSETPRGRSDAPSPTPSRSSRKRRGGSSPTADAST